MLDFNVVCEAIKGKWLCLGTKVVYQCATIAAQALPSPTPHTPTPITQHPTGSTFIVVALNLLL